jgi:cation diffusion facilitator CzcD-associated flavoprotein CzcO
MATSPQSTPTANPTPVEHYDAVIIGAGVTGLYELYRLRQLGISVRLFDDGSGVGGTWYWNRYPGARFDSESYTYGYSFSEELLQEWSWKEHFSGQPENERYLNYVADKFDLRRDIQLNSRVAAAVYDEADNRWDVKFEDGRHVRTQFLVAAVGILSAHFLPEIPGFESFKGTRFHTGRWPKEKVDFTGKRVAVIGTGATAVQLITEIARECGQLTVFQRTPNYCSPLRNSEIDADTQAKIKASYPEIFKRCRETTAAFMHDFDPRSVFEVTEEERLAMFEKLWAEPGFGKWLGNFRDIMTDPAANEIYAEFVRNKIRARIKDPEVARLLVPTDYPFGAKRVPLESGYYEQFNRPNVKLVSIKETPIERFTPKGIKTSDTEYEFDIIILATGFDAVTGSLTRIDIRGEGSQSLKDKWADGPRSYLGLLTAGFPNFFIANAASFCNIPRCSEMVVEWISDTVGYMLKNGYGRIAPTVEAEDAWVDHSNSLVEDSFIMKGNSWFVGVNIPGKKRAFLLYANSAPNYRLKLAEVASNSYEGFLLE